MADLRNSRWMYLKGVLFVGIGLFASALLLLEHPSFKVAILLALAIWAFARAYYFAFYVIEHYIDGEFKFAGLGSFFVYLIKRKKVTKDGADARRPKQ